ncbi:MULTISPECIES: RraA family protein [unclassified Luteococcus]|uniref:RraA family protein n=1 Tax=unclassified Luteococcus TaxID=2639923 RepID=UPI00313DDB0F
MSYGQRIYLQREMPDPEVLDGFRTIPASNVADVMSRAASMNPRIRLVSSPKNQVTAGPAWTVKCRAGDNLALHAALTYCHEGDILVVSNEEDDTRALIGEVMMAHLRWGQKAGGIIIDGPIRDIDEIGTWDFPVYCTGTTPAGPYKEGPGEVNVPVACGGITVHPGDIIVADPDGITVVPRRDGAQVLADARAFQANDEAKLVLARKGEAKRGWVKQNLLDKGFEIIDDVHRP